MTDNEIIKALNYCCGNIKNNDEECNEDMCYQVTLPESRDEGTRFCRQWLIKDALDLINRQNAEIEKWKKKANTPFAKFTFDENKLKEIVADAIGNIEFNLNSVKSEAIKEFAERYRKEIFSITHFNGYVNANLVLSVFNDILKEMTEVSE